MGRFFNSFLGRTALVFLLVGVMFLAFGVPDVIALQSPRQDFNKMEITDFKKGVMVEGEIYAAVGYVAEEYEKEKYNFI